MLSLLNFQTDEDFLVTSFFYFFEFLLFCNQRTCFVWFLAFAISWNLFSFCKWFVSVKVCLFCSRWSECPLHVKSDWFIVLFKTYTLLFLLFICLNYWKTYVSSSLYWIFCFPLQVCQFLIYIFFISRILALCFRFSARNNSCFYFLLFIFFSILVICFNKVCFCKLYHLGLFMVCFCRLLFFISIIISCLLMYLVMSAGDLKWKIVENLKSRVMISSAKSDLYLFLGDG